MLHEAPQVWPGSRRRARELLTFGEGARTVLPCVCPPSRGGSVCRRALFPPSYQPSPTLALNLKSSPTFSPAAFLVLGLQEFYNVLTPHIPGRSSRIRMNY